MGFINLKIKQQLWIAFLLIVVSLFLHRPVNDMLILQSVVYFTPVYLIGILCSERREFIYAKLKNKEVYLLAIAIGLAALQAAFGRVGSYQKAPFLYLGIDILLFQKLALCLFFMVWLHRFEAFTFKPLNVIASTSFAIYFTHVLILPHMAKIQNLPNLGTSSPWLIYPFVTVGTILCALGFAVTVKKLLPNHSRYLIGY